MNDNAKTYTNTKLLKKQIERNRSRFFLYLNHWNFDGAAEFAVKCGLDGYKEMFPLTAFCSVLIEMIVGGDKPSEEDIIVIREKLLNRTSLLMNHDDKLIAAWTVIALESFMPDQDDERIISSKDERSEAVSGFKRLEIIGDKNFAFYPQFAKLLKRDIWCNEDVSHWSDKF